MLHQASSPNASPKYAEQARKIDFGNLKKNELKADAEKKFVTKHKSLSISQHKENRISQIQGTGNSKVDKSMDTSNQNLINGAQLKELNFEPSSVRQPIIAHKQVGYSA